MSNECSFVSEPCSVSPHIYRADADVVGCPLLQPTNGVGCPRDVIVIEFDPIIRSILHKKLDQISHVSSGARVLDEKNEINEFRSQFHSLV